MRIDATGFSAERLERVVTTTAGSLEEALETLVHLDREGEMTVAVMAGVRAWDRYKGAMAIVAEHVRRRQEGLD